MLEDLAAHVLDIAENSVRANGTKVIVTVEESLDKDMLLFSVEDNGKGFEEETLAALRTALDKRTEDDSHMGLCNVYLRLQLFFGGGVEFTIDSKPGRTLIHIGLPRQTPTQGK